MRNTVGDITLNQSINNFRFLIFRFSEDSKIELQQVLTIPVEIFKTFNNSNHCYHVNMNNPDTYKYMGLYYKSATVITIQHAFNGAVSEVWGMK